MGRPARCRRPRAPPPQPRRSCWLCGTCTHGEREGHPPRAPLAAVPLPQAAVSPGPSSTWRATCASLCWQVPCALPSSLPSAERLPAAWPLPPVDAGWHCSGSCSAAEPLPPQWFPPAPSLPKPSTENKASLPREAEPPLLERPHPLPFQPWACPRLCHLGLTGPRVLLSAGTWCACGPLLSTGTTPVSVGRLSSRCPVRPRAAVGRGLAVRPAAGGPNDSHMPPLEALGERHEPSEVHFRRREQEGALHGLSGRRQACSLQGSCKQRRSCRPR